MNSQGVPRRSARNKRARVSEDAGLMSANGASTQDSGTTHAVHANGHQIDVDDAAACLRDPAINGTATTSSKRSRVSGRRAPHSALQPVASQSLEPVAESRPNGVRSSSSKRAHSQDIAAPIVSDTRASKRSRTDANSSATSVVAAGSKAERDDEFWDQQMQSAADHSSSMWHGTVDIVDYAHISAADASWDIHVNTASASGMTSPSEGATSAGSALVTVPESDYQTRTRWIECVSQASMNDLHRLCTPQLLPRLKQLLLSLAQPPHRIYEPVSFQALRDTLQDWRMPLRTRAPFLETGQIHIDQVLTQW